MSRESIYTAIILKKTPYGEADELITLYTKEIGKLRVLAKSVKFAKSKLQYSLQLLFLVRLTATSGNLPKVIGVEVLNSLANIRENLEAANMAFYALELILKFTPDEQKNEALYELVVQFLSLLNSGPVTVMSLALAKFKILFLENLGLGIQADPELLNQEQIGFSNTQGGFAAKQSADFLPITSTTLKNFLNLKQAEFSDLTQFESLDISELHHTLSAFLQYQLEREIKSEGFLDL